MKLSQVRNFSINYNKPRLLSKKVVFCGKNGDKEDVKISESYYYNKLFDEIRSLIKTKTKDGEYIFSQESKIRYDGLQAILWAKNNDVRTYQKLIKYLEYAKEGIIPAYIIRNFPKDGKFFPQVEKEIEKRIQGEDKIKHYDSFEDIEALKPFEVGEFEDSLFYKDKNSISRLNIDKETFEKLFPNVETIAFCQGKNGNCFFVSPLFNLISNPDTRKIIFKCFSQNKDKIIVTISDCPNYPISFPNNEFEINGEQNINGAIGLQMLEFAYAKTRNIKYQTEDLFDTYQIIKGGKAASIYNAFTNRASNMYVKKFKKGVDFLHKYLSLTKEELLNQHLKEIEALKIRIDEIKNNKEMPEYERNSKILELKDKIKIICVGMENDNTLKNTHPLETLEYIDFDNTLLNASSEYDNHCWSVVGFDDEDEEVYAINPWNTACYTRIRKNEFYQQYNSLTVFKI